MEIKKRGIFRESWEYIKFCRKYIYAISIIFLLGTFLGFFLRNDLGFLDSFLRDIVNQTKGMNLPELIFFIFQNNLRSAFFTMLFGIFLGLSPMINALFNGTILGYVFSKAEMAEGFIVIFRVLPHGIFELPAIFISLGMGLKLGLGFIENYFALYKKMHSKKIMGIFSLIGALFGIIIFLAFISNSVYVLNKITWISWVIFVFGIALIGQLFYFFVIKDKALRKIQKEIIAGRIYSSLKVFFVIIIPLLLTAAIIEGILIIAYK